MWDLMICWDVSEVLWKEQVIAAYFWLQHQSISLVMTLTNLENNQYETLNYKGDRTEM